MKIWFIGLLAPVVCLHAVEPEQLQGPQQALARLRAGNEAFMSGRLDVAKYTVARREEVNRAQKPFATVLTCSESTVPPEIIFGQGLGDLVVVRLAGAVAARTALGSIEYAADALGSKLIVVMGHTSCGIVKAAMQPAKPGNTGANMESLYTPIRAALMKPPTFNGMDPWTAGVYASVEQSVQDMVRQSPLLETMLSEGRIGVIGAVYQPETGRVAFSRLISVNGPQIPADSHTPAPAPAKPQPNQEHHH